MGCWRLISRFFHSWWVFLVSAIWIVAVVAANDLRDLGGRLEGRFFPVIDRYEISQPRAYPPPSYRYAWKASAFKVRECKYLGIEWFLGARDDNAVPVDVFYLDAPELREEGLHTWTGLVIELNPVQVVGRSYGDVLHDCPFTPWVVRTPIYTGTGGLE